MKRISIFVVLISMVATTVLAGSTHVFTCDECGFESHTLMAGAGFAGVTYAIVYCPTCEKFLSIPVAKGKGKIDNTDIAVVEPLGKEEFLGKEVLVYPCPECKNKAFAYTGPTCPICRKGKIKKRMKGQWD